MADFIPPEAASDPTYKKFNLKCKVKFIKKSISEDIGKGRRANYDRVMAILIPQESDECYRFYAAWVPDTVEQHFELTGVIGHPVHSPCRFSVHRGHDGRSDRPYLFVMTKGVEDLIVRYKKEGDEMNVVTMPANEDSEADYVEASDGNFRVVD